MIKMIFMFGLTLILIFLLLAVIVFSADRMINYLKRLSSALRWREYVLSFLLVAFATSAPELFIGLSSASLCCQALSLGNIFGANMINATLIVGLAAILSRNLRLPKSVGLSDAGLAGLSALLPLILLLDGRLGRTDGLVLLSFSAIYFFFILKGRLEGEKRTSSGSGPQALKAFVLFVFWTLVLVFSSRVLVGQAAAFVREAHTSLFAVGLIIVSLGTTLPEAIFAMRSAAQKDDDLVYGNLLGTLIVNSGFILGSVSLIAPIEIANRKEVFFSGIMLLASVLLLLSFMRSGRKISWQEGLVLIATFFISLAGQYFIR